MQYDMSGNYLKSHGTITVSEFRQMINTSRKYAVPFMEYCDAIGFTVRDGDHRRLKEDEYAGCANS